MPVNTRKEMEGCLLFLSPVCEKTSAPSLTCALYLYPDCCCRCRNCPALACGDGFEWKERGRYSPCSISGSAAGAVSSPARAAGRACSQNSKRRVSECRQHAK